MPMSSTMKNIDMSRSLPFVAGWGTTLPTFSYSKWKLVKIYAYYNNYIRIITMYSQEKLLKYLIENSNFLYIFGS